MHLDLEQQRGARKSARKCCGGTSARASDQRNKVLPLQTYRDGVGPLQLGRGSADALGGGRGAAGLRHLRACERGSVCRVGCCCCFGFFPLSTPRQVSPFIRPFVSRVWRQLPPPPPHKSVQNLSDTSESFMHKNRIINVYKFSLFETVVPSNFTQKRLIYLTAFHRNISVQSRHTVTASRTQTNINREMSGRL